MKATIRVPMPESFAYVEFETDIEETGAGLNKVFRIYQAALILAKAGKSDNDF